MFDHRPFSMLLLLPLGLIYDLPLLSNSNDLEVEKEEFFNAVRSPRGQGQGRGAATIQCGSFANLVKRRISPMAQRPNDQCGTCYLLHHT